MIRYVSLKSTIFTLFLFLVTVISPLNAWSAPSNQLKNGVAPRIEQKCIADLSTRLSIPADEIECIQAKRVTWPNSALGMEQPGMMYSMALVPGWKFILETRNVKYLYTASDTYFRYGGPLYLWKYSALYVNPDESDPNLNGNLIQVSMMGTHPRTILNGVAEFYPQTNGGIIATRRTSRSGFDLLYLPPGKTNRPIPLGGAFEYVTAAINAKGDEWIAVQKGMVGFEWEITKGKVPSKPEDNQTIGLPDGCKPVGSVWNKNGFYVSCLINGRVKAFHITDQNKLEEVFDNPVPPDGGFMMNKSESVSVENIEVAGKKQTVVSRVWFNGAVKTKVTLRNFEYLHSTPLPYGNLLVTGLQNDKNAAYVVNFNDGSSHLVISGVNSTIKYWDAPPQQSLVP